MSFRSRPARLFISSARDSFPISAIDGMRTSLKNTVEPTAVITEKMWSQRMNRWTAVIQFSFALSPDDEPSKIPGSLNREQKRRASWTDRLRWVNYRIGE